jgi:hypothetical protein
MYFQAEEGISLFIDGEIITLKSMFEKQIIFYCVSVNLDSY